MKIVTVIGARPQFIKAATVSREISNYNKLSEVIIHTGQHFDNDMSDVFFEEMGMPQPNYNLGINSVSHGAMTGRMLEEIEVVLVIEKPDLVIVYGDTNSTLAGALAAKKLNIKIAHIEAGLRSFNMQMPEEINRILTDRISDFLFCPTDQAIDNLKLEGLNSVSGNVFKCGDVMLDSAIYCSRKSDEKSEIINKYDLLNSEFVLATIHRQENTDDVSKFKKIINALNDLHNNKIKVILPLHPRTKKIINENDIEVDFKTIPPVGYFDMIQLIKQSKLVITDSGGLQKEAFFFSKKCITVREQTEWVELVKGGFNILLPVEEIDFLSQKFDVMISNVVDFDINLYGNGRSAKRVVDVIRKIILE